MLPARVYSTNNKVQARLVESRLKEAGLQVVLRHGQTGVPVLQPGGPFEVWIEDGSLLEDPLIEEAISAALNPSKFTTEEEDAIEAMNFQDEPSEVGYGLLLVLFILGIVALILLLQFWPSILNFFSGRG